MDDDDLVPSMYRRNKDSYLIDSIPFHKIETLYCSFFLPLYCWLGRSLPSLSVSFDLVCVAMESFKLISSDRIRLVKRFCDRKERRIVENKVGLRVLHCLSIFYQYPSVVDFYLMFRRHAINQPI